MRCWWMISRVTFNMCRTVYVLMVAAMHAAAPLMKISRCDGALVTSIDQPQPKWVFSIAFVWHPVYIRHVVVRDIRYVQEML